jgi:hypothetical protein
LKLFREVAQANPYRPEPYALALASAKRLNDAEGIQWACLGILSQAWTADQTAIEDRALRVAKSTIDQLRNAEQSQQADEFEKALEDVRMRDVIVKVRWTGDADVDLMIEEPSGTICSLQTPRTTGGGVLVGDAYASGTSSDGYTETYVCPQGFSGKYRMLIHRVWGNVTAGKVTLDIYKRDAEQPHIHKQIDLGEKDALVLFDLNQGRRIEPLAQRQLANLQPEKVDANRAMLARQLSRYEDSLAHRDFLKSRTNQRRGFRGPGAVGFRPVITTLPSGVQLMPGTTAIVSADRRYVRVTPIPMFSFVGDVNTFNFGAPAQGGLPDDDDDDDNN